MVLANTNSSSQTFTVTNTGVGTLTLEAGSITLTGANADQFTLTDNNTYPINLSSNQTCTVSAKFSPTSGGVKNANIQFTSNAPSSPTTVALSGNALAAGSLFESFEGTWLPTGWSADASSWAQNTSTAYDGTKSAYLYTSSTITDKKLITPKVTITGSSQLSYYAKTGSGSYQKIQVKYSTDKTNWTNIGSQITLASTFTQYTVDLSSLTGQNVYLA
ncbi:MAG TPA: choice-of-anchor D domain-containing protein, partial [Bacteroidales bacterium]|nr:choice-of-anchor D domain-containing protein [Bacteroidales bacterium]